MTMSYEDFLAAMAEILDTSVEKLNELQLCRETGFDSMGKINVALYIDETFDWQIPLLVLDECETVLSLHNKICTAVQR